MSTAHVDWQTSGGDQVLACMLKSPLITVGINRSISRLVMCSSDQMRVSLAALSGLFPASLVWASWYMLDTKGFHICVDINGERVIVG